MNKRKTVTGVLLSSLLILSGCGKQSADSSMKEEKETPVSDAYNTWKKTSEGVKTDNYTADYECHYTMTFSDNTKTSFDLSGNLKVDNESSSYTQNVNSNGTEFALAGYYMNGRLYNSYNDIKYYEDMSFEDYLGTLMVPFDSPSWSNDEIESITGEKDSEGNTVYTISFKDGKADDVFSSRYDAYGLKDYDDYKVKSSEVILQYDSKGNRVQEKTKFTSSVSYSSQSVSVEYESLVKYSDNGSTEVSISDDTKEELKSYVPYDQIDTSGSEESDGNTVTEQFKNRIVSQLGYELQDDGTYKNEFNTNEAYIIDFNNCTFTYGRYSIAYVYNWKNDSASSSTCNYNFVSGSSSNGCDTSVLDTMKEVKQDLEMELYYCGLSLEDLQAESK